MNGAGNWRQIVEDLHIRYLFWGEREEEAYGGFVSAVEGQGARRCLRAPGALSTKWGRRRRWRSESESRLCSLSFVQDDRSLRRRFRPFTFALT